MFRSLLQKTKNYLGLSKTNTDGTAYLALLQVIKNHSPTTHEQIIKEINSQRNTLKMIASENYSSLAVQMTMGMLLTDKYAEGYPGCRYYEGCDNIDKIETDACNSANQLFLSEHAYVQPHSGSDANLMAIWAIISKRIEKPFLTKTGKSLNRLTSQEYNNLRSICAEQKILAPSIDSGGHLTHGNRVNITSKMFDFVHYKVNPKTFLIDYQEIETMAAKEKPAIIIAGYSAYSRLINFATMKEIAQKHNAVLMVDMAHFAGLVAGKVLKGDFDPVPFADVITSTTHKTLRGPRGGMILCKNPYKDFVNKGCPMVAGGPLPHVIASKGIAFKEALKPSFKDYAHQIVVNAKALADSLESNGLNVLTGGTDNHMVLCNVGPNRTGRDVAKLLLNGNIVTNANLLPYDTRGPLLTSGIRLGVAALTTRGMKSKEMVAVGKIIGDLLKTCNTKKSKESVATILDNFPLYPSLGELK